MTANQIAYQKLLEDQRSHKAGEAQKVAELEESSRHNRASESVEMGKLGEAIRINTINSAETQRSNLARELETNRSNLASERIKRETNVINQAIAANKLSEERRFHDLSTETARRGQDITSSDKMMDREQDWQKAKLDREQKDKLNTRDNFVSILETGVRSVSGLAQQLAKSLIR